MADGFWLDEGSPNLGLPQMLWCLSHVETSSPEAARRWFLLARNKANDSGDFVVCDIANRHLF